MMQKERLYKICKYDDGWWLTPNLASVTNAAALVGNCLGHGAVFKLGMLTPLEKLR
jgi:hypothetical protein